LLCYFALFLHFEGFVWRLDFGIWNLDNEIATLPAAPRNDKQKWSVSASPSQDCFGFASQ